MSNATEQTQQPTEQPGAGNQAGATERADQLPLMTAEAARRLAALLAPHLLAMRAVTAGTRYGACVSADAAAGSSAAVSTADACSAATSSAAASSAAASSAAVAQAPPASAATRIFIAGMLERLSA